MKDQVNYNIAQNIIGGLYISTATWHTGIIAVGESVKNWETFVWQWNPKDRTRGKILKQFNHNTENQAIDFHFRYCKGITYRHLKSKSLNPIV